MTETPTGYENDLRTVKYAHITTNHDRTIGSLSCPATYLRLTEKPNRHSSNGPPHRGALTEGSRPRLLFEILGIPT